MNETLDFLRGTLRSATTPLSGNQSDFDRLFAMVGDARFVLLGEASHGTHEFYRIRAEITKRLIREKGFSAIAVEADWPDAYRVNRFARGAGTDPDAEAALGGFTRFPQWMWRNADVLDFVGWLRAHNQTEPDRSVGFYGLDLYSLHRSIQAVLEYLRIVDPEAARRAERRYGCFDHHGEDPQAYGQAAALNLHESCESEAIHQLLELRARAAEYASRDGRLAEDDLFYAERNARVVTSAEAYYRAMFRGGRLSWNLRDRHMAETLTGPAIQAGLRRDRRLRSADRGVRREWVGPRTVACSCAGCRSRRRVLRRPGEADGVRPGAAGPGGRDPPGRERDRPRHPFQNGGPPRRRTRQRLRRPSSFPGLWGPTPGVSGSGRRGYPGRWPKS